MPIYVSQKELQPIRRDGQQAEIITAVDTSIGGGIPTPTTIMHNNTSHCETYITGINSGMVTTALGFTPYSASNPSGFITTSALTPYATKENASFTGDLYVCGNIRASGDVSAFSAADAPLNWWDSMPTATATVKGGVKIGCNLSIDANGVLSSTGGGVSSWNDLLDKPLTFAPATHNNSQHSETYITGINSSMVTTALGYTPYSNANPSGFISGINSSMVTTALGYTPYNSSNPSGYITSSALSPYAPLANPSFTGTVNLPSAISLKFFPAQTSPVAGMLGFGDGTGWRFDFVKATNSSTKLVTISDTGSVAVNTTVANAKVNVVGSPNSYISTEKILLIERPYNAGNSFTSAASFDIGGVGAATRLDIKLLNSNRTDLGNTDTIVTTFLSGGQVGFGTTSPAADRILTISRNANVGIKLISTGTNGRSYSILSTDAANGVVGALAFYDDTAGAYRMYISSAGNVVMNNNLSVVGEVTAFASSDERLKENIQPFKGLDIINKIQPVTFNWNERAKELNDKKDSRNNFGVIAQQVEEILPELVHEIYNEYKSVDYQQLIPILIQGMKELQLEINNLKSILCK